MVKIAVSTAANDEAWAECIRNKLLDLRDAIISARATGLTIEIPELFHLYLDGGTASGSPSDWKIYRSH